MAKMMSTRDPYPFPKFQSDDNFVGPRSTQKDPYSLPPHLAQKAAPFDRLSNKSTLASQRREVHHYDPEAPHDSLDFVLKSTYNHHKEFLKGAEETLVQPETLGSSGRVLKNRTIYIAPDKPELGHPLRVAEVTKKEDNNSIKNAIEGHHTQTTNRGYSRKPDGGFFTS